MKPRYVFVVGGVCSSLGKGITAASIALLLERQNLCVACMKMDPYLNVDPGTMSPYQHGEVYVTDDGAETDLDLGHYARFTQSPLSKLSSVSSGQIYESVIQKERRGDYLGQTVQVIPHITDEIQQRIHACQTQTPGIDVVVVEIGGTAGDIESLPFLEAIRQFIQTHSETSILVHLTYVPYLKAAGEIKTKPTQNSVHALQGFGLQPDFILCRSETPLGSQIRDKIALYCNIPPGHVMEETDVQHTIYEVPLQLKAQQLDQKILKQLDLPFTPSSLDDFSQFVTKSKSYEPVVTIGFVGKYVQHKDAYKSVVESLRHAAEALRVELKLKLIEAEQIHAIEEIDPIAQGCDAFLIPGGFGQRGWQGKLHTATYCRTRGIPYFGICFGMQVIAVEYARNVLGLLDANSREVDPQTPEPIIDLMTEQKAALNLGGSLRLGAYPCRLDPNSLAYQIYQQELIFERHRHRFELNTQYVPQLTEAKLLVSGTLDQGVLPEIIEIQDHPWMLGVQFHPEFLSKPTKPHPLFLSFIQAALHEKHTTSCP